MRGGNLPPPLQDRYGGDLAVQLRGDRPTIAVNFVSTLDGVVSYGTPEATGGGEISGFFEPDRFVMGLLRSLSDAVLIGAGTLRAGAGEAWTPQFIHPDSAAEYGALRASLRLAANPTTVVVTGSGEIDLDRPGLADPEVPVLIVTSDHAAPRLHDVRSHVAVVTAGTDAVEPLALVARLAERGFGLVLCEGGPHLFGELLAAALVDELFLTIAPQIAGRGKDSSRLALVEGVGFDVEGAKWGTLIGLRQAAHHLFVRYRF